MKYFKYVFLLLVVLLFSLLFIFNAKNNKINIKEIENTTNDKFIAAENCYLNSNKYYNSEVEDLTIEEKIEKEINNMALDEKIGQMLIISISGTKLTDSTKRELNTYHPGGVILFANNLNSITNTRNFINSLQKNSKIPLFISVDQEGGQVQRLKNIKGITNIPAMSKVGKLNNMDSTYKLGVAMGEELKALGFNMDFAPVIDVSFNNKSFIGNRSFGSDPYIVANLGVEIAKGLESNNIIPVYKHFPGHGGTITDSHYSLPILNKTKDDLYKYDLIPFQTAIKNDAKVIMIGHLAVPNIDNNIPASLSKEIITNLLKNELGYNGLVITDALNMGALSKNYNEKQIYEMAINAGVDILLMPNSSKSAIKYIKQSISENKILISQIDESVKKILTLKYNNLDNTMLSTSYIGNKEHLEIANQF